jgi:hypothetical protein
VSATSSLARSGRAKESGAAEIDRRKQKNGSTETHLPSSPPTATTGDIALSPFGEASARGAAANIDDDETGEFDRPRGAGDEARAKRASGTVQIATHDDALVLSAWLSKRGGGGGGGGPSPSSPASAAAASSSGSAAGLVASPPLSRSNGRWVSTTEPRASRETMRIASGASTIDSTVVACTLQKEMRRNI